MSVLADLQPALVVVAAGEALAIQATLHGIKRPRWIDLLEFPAIWLMYIGLAYANVLAHFSGVALYTLTAWLIRPADDDDDDDDDGPSPRRRRSKRLTDLQEADWTREWA